MVEMDDMRAAGRIASKAVDFLGSEKLSHRMRVLSGSVLLEWCLSYVILGGAE
jgi:hypothetical protein